MSAIGDDPLLRDLPSEDGGKRLDQYLLTERLGRGGMGAVYRGRHLQLGTDVAVKLLMLQEDAYDEELVRRFWREAQLAARVRSDHLIRVIDLRISEGLHYMVMDLVDGLNVDQWVKRSGGSLEIREALTIARDAALGLGAAHRHEPAVVHRDVKPANIMIAATGEVKVADLGIARIESEPGLTQDEALLGTPNYMAPEQVTDSKSAGAPSDVYGIGASLYFMLTGKHPFQGQQLYEVLRSVPKGLPDLGKLCPDLPREVIKLQREITAVQPGRRPADGIALAARIDQVLAGLGGPVVPGATPATLPGMMVDSEPTIDGKAPGRVKSRAGRVVVAVVLLGLLGGGAYAFRDQLFQSGGAEVDGGGGPVVSAAPFAGIGTWRALLVHLQDKGEAFAQEHVEPLRAWVADPAESVAGLGDDLRRELASGFGELAGWAAPAGVVITTIAERLQLPAVPDTPTAPAANPFAGISTWSALLARLQEGGEAFAQEHAEQFDGWAAAPPEALAELTVADREALAAGFAGFSAWAAPAGPVVARILAALQGLAPPVKPPEPVDPFAELSGWSALATWLAGHGEAEATPFAAGLTGWVDAHFDEIAGLSERDVESLQRELVKVRAWAEPFGGVAQRVLDEIERLRQRAESQSAIEAFESAAGWAAKSRALQRLSDAQLMQVDDAVGRLYRDHGAELRRLLPESRNDVRAVFDARRGKLSVAATVVARIDAPDAWMDFAGAALASDAASWQSLALPDIREGIPEDLKIGECAQVHAACRRAAWAGTAAARTILGDDAWTRRFPRSTSRDVARAVERGDVAALRQALLTASPDALERSPDSAAGLLAWLCREQADPGARAELLREVVLAVAEPRSASRPRDLQVRLDGALRTAARSDHADQVRVLLAFGAAPGALGEQRRNALHVAAESGAREACNALLDGLDDAAAQALLTARDEFDYTPIRCTVPELDARTFEQLLKVHQRLGIEAAADAPAAAKLVGQLMAAIYVRAEDEHKESRPLQQVVAHGARIMELLVEAFGTLGKDPLVPQEIRGRLARMRESRGGNNPLPVPRQFVDDLEAALQERGILPK